jgi:hypothetical protein
MLAAIPRSNLVETVATRYIECFEKPASIVNALASALATMEFCEADACPSCSLPEGTPACLRQKGHFCMWLAAKSSQQDVRAALEKLSLDLMEEARVVEMYNSNYGHSE